MNLQFYKLSYILNVRIICKDIKIKNKYENKKIEKLILYYFNIRYFETKCRTADISKIQNRLLK